MQASLIYKSDCGIADDIFRTKEIFMKTLIKFMNEKWSEKRTKRVGKSRENGNYSVTNQKAKLVLRESKERLKFDFQFGYETSSDFKRKIMQCF